MLEPMNQHKMVLPITGMSCANCAMNIERTVKKLEGVEDVNVNFAAEQAAVSFDPEQLNIKDVVGKIRSSGFDVVTTKVELPVTGMTCANCAMNIERALNNKVPGVVHASVNFAAERVFVDYIPGVSNIDEIISAIKKQATESSLPMRWHREMTRSRPRVMRKSKTRPESLLPA